MPVSSEQITRSWLRSCELFMTMMDVEHLYFGTNWTCNVSSHTLSSTLLLCPSSRVLINSAQQRVMHLWLRKTSVSVLAGRLSIQNKTESPIVVFLPSLQYSPFHS